MSETDESYGLLSQTSSIAETRSERWQRHLPTAIGLHWLRAGWQDLTNQPVPSLAYGLGVYLVSIALVWLLAYFGRDYILFHALSGRSEEHTSELQSLMRISYAVFCLKKKKHNYKY